MVVIRVGCNKISSSRVNITNKQGIKQLGFPFGFIFLRPSQGPRSYQPGEIPGPRLLITALSRFYTCGYCSYRSVSCCLNKVYVYMLILTKVEPAVMLRSAVQGLK